MNSKIKKPLRIAILVPRFPNIVQTYILNHILFLKKSGAEVFIIAQSDPKQSEVHPAINKYKLIKDTVYINTDGINILKQIFNIPFYKLRYLTALKRIIFSRLWKHYGLKYTIKTMLSAKSLSFKKFDIIHSHTLFSSYEYLYLKDIFNIPIVTTFHGLEPKSSKILAVKKIDFVLDKANIFIVNTHFAQKQLTDMGCNIEKIHIIPQGTNTDEFIFKMRNITEGNVINILSVGRLSIEKGFHVAIKAVAALVKEYPNIRYHIIGGGPEKANLHNLIQRYNLHDTVYIHGSVSTDILKTHYANAHVFILPSIDFHDESHTETQGVVLQEAQASGLPVIASRTGGIPEVINDGQTGLLFDEGNTQQLASRIKELILDKNLYNRLCISGSKDVEENYDISVVCKKLLSAYNGIIRGSS